MTVETDWLQAFKELQESYSTTSNVGSLIDEILILGSQMQCFSWSFDRKKDGNKVADMLGQYELSVWL